MDLEQLFTILLSLAGYPALVAIIVDVLKRFGVVKDGQAQNWTTGFNLLGLVLLFVAGFFPAVDIPGVDGWLANIAKLLAMILSLLPANLISRAAHAVLKTSFMGYSFTNAARGYLNAVR